MCLSYFKKYQKENYSNATHENAKEGARFSDFIWIFRYII